MKKQTEDLRYKRTQRNLKSALIELLETKNINQISVRELSEHADINRATFYLHYDSPYDLLISLENELFDIIYLSYKDYGIKNPDAFFMILYNCISENYKLSKILFRPNSSYNFWERLRSAIQSYYVSNWETHDLSYTKKELEYYSAFLVEGYLSVIKYWLYNGMKESPEYMVKLSKKFLPHIQSR